MSTPTVSIFIDSYHPKQDGTCKVSIRVTSGSTKRYYPTNISLTEKHFNKIMTGQRLGEADKVVLKKIEVFKERVKKAIEKLPAFTFNNFEKIYLENRDAPKNISDGFNDYIKKLKEGGQIGTAVNYETALNSINKFRAYLKLKGEFKYADITPELLKDYEKWMTQEKKEVTTVSIYLRALRSIMNKAAIDKSLYPFGRGKYEIPTSNNKKKALTLQQVNDIFNYQVRPGSTEERSRDYWIFMYLCGGMNVKDLCFLKRKNIDGNIIRYKRSKTANTKKEASEVVVSLKPEAEEIINRHAQPSIGQDAYIFPHLETGMSATKVRKIYQQLTKTTNKYMKRIAKNLGITEDISCQWARHSFATVLRRSGASTAFISERLNHSSEAVTKNYLDSFEDQVIHDTTEALRPVRKPA